MPYYRLLAENFPEWQKALNTAISALDVCADYGGFLWIQGFTFDSAGFEKFRQAEARKALADAGREAMQNDIVAVEQFEAILGTENGIIS